MTAPHFSERVRSASDDELREMLVTNDPSWGAHQLARNEIERRRQTSDDRNAKAALRLSLIAIVVSIVAVLVAVVGIIVPIIV